VKGDPNRLRQILVNLLGNAVKFTHDGEVSISVTLKGCVETPGSGQRAILRFEVADTGEGIEEDRIAVLFEPFTQADSSVTRKFGGTGLGLAICKQLAEAMEGEIGVQSTQGLGSAFHVTLPLPVDNKSGVTRKLDGVRVLVADDHALRRTGILEHLRAGGAQLSEARSWREAAETRSRMGEALDAIVVDASALDHPGSLWTPAEPREQAPALIVLLERNEEERAERLLRNDPWTALYKPIRMADLDAMLLAMTGAAQQREEHAASATDAAGAAIDPDTAILLVEDNAVNQKVAMRLLEHLGLRCDIAGNGKEAVRAVRSKAYDVILMDCQMPEMDGFEATERIRELEHGASAPIIAMTALAMKGDEERCVSAGMDWYLSKPLTAGDLLDALKKCTQHGENREKEAPMAEPNEFAALNRERLEEVTAGDRELTAELGQTYIEDMDARMQELEDALAAGDASKAREVAHAIKGSSANMGAERAREVASSIEEACAENEIAKGRSLLPELKDAYAAAAGALKELCA
jgi:CheY-like chemotaxis protein/HPt (histidine-containing phosphotransfer) domain-containing protein